MFDAMMGCCRVNVFERGVHVVMCCNGKSLVPYHSETHIILLTTECQSTNLCSRSARVLNVFQFFIFMNLG